MDSAVERQQRVGVSSESAGYCKGASSCLAPFLQQRQLRQVERIPTDAWPNSSHFINTALPNSHALSWNIQANKDTLKLIINSGHSAKD